MVVVVTGKAMAVVAAVVVLVAVAAVASRSLVDGRVRETISSRVVVGGIRRLPRPVATEDNQGGGIKTGPNKAISNNSNSQVAGVRYVIRSTNMKSAVVSEIAETTLTQ